MGIEPTTSGLDLPLLCRLSYEVGQRKSGTPTELRGRTEKVGDDLAGESNPEVVGSIPTEVKRNFSLPRVVP